MATIFMMPTENELSIRTLNNVAVEYFELGLQDLSYQIWDELYHKIQSNAKDYEALMPVVSCNMGNMLRQTGYYEEAWQVLTQGLKRCFGTGAIYAMPELVMQLSILRLKFGNMEAANSLYSFGKNIFLWSRQMQIDQTLEDVLERDFLLYCEETI